VVGLMLSRGILDRADAEGRVFLGRRLYLFGLSHLTHFDVMRLASVISTICRKSLVRPRSFACSTIANMWSPR